MVKKKYSRILEKKSLFFKILMKIEFCWRLIFEIFTIQKPSLGSFEVRHKILDPIGSAVLTLIEYKQTDRKTSKVYIIYILGF